MFDIALITCSDMPELHPEDKVLIQALERQGLTSSPAIWDQPNQKTPKKGWLMRTAWDYVEKQPQFVKWLQTLPGDRCWNSPSLMIWNTHKSYLLDIQAAGGRIVPTELFRPGQEIGPPRQGRWVAKPAVSSGSKGALLGDWNEVQPHLRALLQEQDALLQPYFAAVETYRERSLIFVNNQFQHAVIRTVALVEGRGVDRIHTRTEPSPHELVTALKILRNLPQVPLYARVDLLPDQSGTPHLMELEIIEPQLFLLEAPETADTLARAIYEKTSK